MDISLLITDIVARGGGGGSGSGGGGGGGGIFVGWFYIVALVAQAINKIPRPLNYLVFIIYSILVTLLCFWLPLGFLFWVIGAIGIWYGGTGRLRAMHKYIKEHARIHPKLKVAASTDSQWDWELIKPNIEALFYKFQSDWSALNRDGMKDYLTPNHHSKMMLLLGALSAQNRQNIMKDIKIKHIIPTYFADSHHNEQDDLLVVTIEAKAHDELQENGSTLYVDKSTFIEHWHFRRDLADTKWLLSDIEQSSRDKRFETASLKNFADNNRFFYSGDFGWLLMPKRGQLFHKADFKQSDINSHVIGSYRGLLVQFYRYIPLKNRNNNQGYTIAQAALPKTYNNIVVRRKKGWWSFGISGLRKLETEWGDFNKKYEVWASDLEQATSLELLHPIFMEKLESLPFATSIEIVDNNVYFYTEDLKADYNVLLLLLHEAFDEMKL